MDKRSAVPEELFDEDQEDEGLAELDFNEKYLPIDEDDADYQDIHDYYNMVDSGVDDSDPDPFDGFQIRNIEDEDCIL